MCVCEPLTLPWGPLSLGFPLIGKSGNTTCAQVSTSISPGSISPAQGCLQVRRSWIFAIESHEQKVGLTHPRLETPGAEVSTGSRAASEGPAEDTCPEPGVEGGMVTELLWC